MERTIQDSMRLGKSHDIFYYTSESTSKQSIPTVVDNRFYQALTTLGAGSSTFIFSPSQGLSDIIMSMKLPEQGVVGGGGVDYTGLVLPRGWGYAALNRISIRYGSSSQFFQLGSQVLLENLREMPNPTTRDQLFELGGALMKQLSDFAGDNLYCYLYLNFPHNSPNGSLMKPNPFDTSLLSGPVVVTVELNPLSQIFSSTSADLTGVPAAFEKGYIQVKQVIANDSSKLMKMGSDTAYSFPTKAFYQNEVQIQVGAPLASPAPPAVPTRHNLLLSGFRNGEVSSLFFWVTRNSDTNPNRNTGFVVQTTNYILPGDVEFLYNGTVFYRTFDKASQMFSVISTETPSNLSCTVLSIVGGTPATISSESSTASWTEIPFAQVFEQLSGSHLYVSGKKFENAVANLAITLPDADAYTIHVVYSYNAVLLTKGGMSEYVF